MGVILLEAFAALAVLGAIVWWTMFAGRHRGERQAIPADDSRVETAASPGAAPDREDKAKAPPP